MRKYFLGALLAGAIISFSAASVMANSSCYNAEETVLLAKEKEGKKKKTKKDASKAKSCEGKAGAKPGCCASKSKAS